MNGHGGRYGDYSGLYDVDVAETKALAHKSDPQTSYDAAEKMVKSGALSRQEEQVLETIKFRLSFEPYTWKSDFTAKELATTSVVDYYTIQRRLSGLHNKGKIERTGEKRGACMVWRLTERKA